MSIRRPLIGLTTRAPDEEGRYALSDRYIACVRRAGGDAILLPPGAPDLPELLNRLQLSGLILSGGGDIEPSLYGGDTHQEIYGINTERDQSELLMVKYASVSHLPLLGICRGIQVMNVAFGGTLMAHLPDRVGEAVPHRLPEKQEVCHSVKLIAGSAIAKLMGQETVDVPSCHHQAIDRLASVFKPTAYASDGIIEAVEMPEHRFFIGVQWHPELSESPLQQKLFDAFVEAANAS